MVKDDPGAVYASDDRKLFCRHCGRTHIRHRYVAGFGFLCDPPENTSQDTNTERNGG